MVGGRAILRAVAGLWVLAASSCNQSELFHCAASEECGPSGTCEATGFCAFPDTRCPSGRRFGDFAGVYAGTCVDEDGTGSTGLPPGSGTSGGTTLPTTSSPPLTTTPVGDGSSSDATSGEATTGGPAVTTDSPSGSSTGDGPITVGPMQIATNFDDGCMFIDVDTGEAYLPSGEAAGGFLGEFPTGEPYYGYFRFALPRAIPAGSTIEDVLLTLTGHGVYMWDPADHALTVEIEDSPDAGQVDGIHHFPPMGGTQLAADNVRWPAMGGLSWTVDGPNQAPNLTVLVQLLVDTYGGLNAGSHIQFWIRKDGLGITNSEVAYVDYAASPEDAATLAINFF